MREVSISTQDVELSGDLDVPDGASGVVPFADGSGSSRHSPRNRFVADALREARLATLLMDLLTESEEVREARTGELRFDIDLLSEGYRPPWHGCDKIPNLSLRSPPRRDLVALEVCT